MDGFGNVLNGALRNRFDFVEGVGPIIFRMILAIMSDPVFGSYILRFKRLRAFSKETAVTIENLFPKGRTARDFDRMHKLLKSGVVKSSGANQYWFDRKEYYFGITPHIRERFVSSLLAVVIAIALYIVWKLF